jgi:transcriptional regulator with XRE-family HTH domain
VRWHRRRGGLSQEELAERAGVSVRALRGIELGQVRAPRPSTVRLLAEALALDGSARAKLVATLGEDGLAVPAELPAEVADFTGRAALVQRLAQLLREPAPGAQGPPVVVIGGAAGVGKTALALHVAHRVRSAFPDGQLYAELAGAQAAPAAPEDVLAAFLQRLGSFSERRREDLAGRAALLRSRLQGRRVLLLLDDARDASQVRPLLPAAAGCAVVVTTRGRMGDLAGATVVDLTVLTDDEATALLERIAGPDAVAADPGATRRVVAFCGGLPLAVRIAGARAAVWSTWGLRRLADRLSDEHRRLDQLAVGDLAVRSSIALTYQGLGTEERRAFRLLGALAVPAPPAWVAPALLDRPARQAERLLDHLVDVRLVDEASTHDTVRYRLHDLVRLYARERADVEDGRDAVRDAVACAGGAWLAVADRVHLQVPGGFVRTVTGSAPRPPVRPERVDELDDPGTWFDGERTNVLALLRQAVTLDLDALAWDLAGAPSPSWPSATSSTRSRASSTSVWRPPGGLRTRVPRASSCASETTCSPSSTGTRRPPTTSTEPWRVRVRPATNGTRPGRSTGWVPSPGRRDGWRRRSGS